jgi:SAM-dependent methyltransferase
MEPARSISEEHGIALLSRKDLAVYSVGISTGGSAEIRMAKGNPSRHIIATTIDREGLDFAVQCIHQHGLDSRIEAKFEDVSQPLPYPNGTFDYIYARLVLHYLARAELEIALRELHRVLKPSGKLFIVVRSHLTHDAKRQGAFKIRLLCSQPTVYRMVKAKSAHLSASSIHLCPLRRLLRMQTSVSWRCRVTLSTFMLISGAPCGPHNRMP